MAGSKMRLLSHFFVFNIKQKCTYNICIRHNKKPGLRQEKEKKKKERSTEQQQKKTLTLPNKNYQICLKQITYLMYKKCYTQVDIMIYFFFVNCACIARCNGAHRIAVNCRVIYRGIV